MTEHPHGPPNEHDKEAPACEPVPVCGANPAPISAAEARKAMGISMAGYEADEHADEAAAPIALNAEHIEKLTAAADQLSKAANHLAMELEELRPDGE